MRIPLGSATGSANREDLVVGRQPRNTLGSPSGPVAEHTLPACLTAPESSSDSGRNGERVGQGGDEVRSRRVVHAAPGVDVLSDDRVRRPDDPAAGAERPFRERFPWQVVGDPERWTPGTRFYIERVTG